MTCFYYITRTTIIYSLYEHDFGLPWLWDTDRGNTYISLTAARFDRRLVSSVAERGGREFESPPYQHSGS